MRSGRKTVAIVAFVILVLYAGLLTVQIIWLRMECRASDILLDKLALARPGARITEIGERLGRQMSVYSRFEDIRDWGTIKEESFCRDKRLYVFYAVTPPCRTVDVYTDVNDMVVYVTWHSL